MFKEGLAPLRGAWQVGASEERDTYSCMTSQMLKPVANFRNISHDSRLPSATNFQIGNAPSRGFPTRASVALRDDDSGSGSDMDLSLSDDDGAQSHKSSPILEAVVSKSAVPARNCLEDRLSDSATTSLEYSYTDIKSNDGGVYAARRTCGTTGDSLPVTSTRIEAEATSQDIRSAGNLNKELSRNNSPSAPPLSSDSEIDHNINCCTTSKAHSVSLSTKLDSSTINKRTIHSVAFIPAIADDTCLDTSKRAVTGAEVEVSPNSLPARFPTFHASGLGPWYSIIAYDACVRLCLNSWAKGYMEEEGARYFLNNECAVLRTTFGLHQQLLQSEEELLAERPSELVSEGVTSKPNKNCGKLKVQVRRIKMGVDSPPGCSFKSLKPAKVNLDSIRRRISSLNVTLSSGWRTIREVHVTRHIPSNSSFSRKSLAYLQASTQYMKQVSRVLMNDIITLQDSSTLNEYVQEAYSCRLRLKSSPEDELIRMHPGSGESHVFLPESLVDDLIVEVQDSNGHNIGRVVAQVADISDNQGEKLRWWSIYNEPAHEIVGRVQLYIHYSTSREDYNQNKCGSVAETLAYDLVLEVSMKAQHVQQRNLLLSGPWKWLVSQFVKYYGVSDVYAKLRYLSYVMDVATPTKDCIDLIHDLLLPVLMKGHRKSVLSHQENRLLGEIEEQVQQLLASVFEDYKSLDESAPSGLMDVIKTATGFPAPALASAVKLYSLLNDILLPESQLKLCRNFQVATKRRSRRHLAETDELIGSNNEFTSNDHVSLSIYYQKMKSLILGIRNEIRTDIEIQNHNVLPSFIDLQNISTSIYSVELCNRLREFLVACPPSSPSPTVVELIIATADFQRDLSSWNINHVKGGVDARELFHSYISHWIEEKRLALLDACKLEKVVCYSDRTQDLTTPFVDDMYDRLKETVDDFKIIISRWPGYYAISLENVIADVEKAIIEALEKQYAEFLSPLKDNLIPKLLGLKYVQKLAKGAPDIYVVPDELGIFLNSIKRMLEILRPRIETQLRSWCSCSPDGNKAVGERLSEVTVLLRAKFRSYMQAVVEKLAENTRIHSATKLKKIVEDLKETMAESDVQSQMQPLKDLLVKTIEHLHLVFAPRLFIAICRGLWNRMGQDIICFLRDRKDKSSWYKGSRISASILDDIFATKMQELLGNALQEKDLEAPRSIMEVRSVLCKDSINPNESFYY